MMPPAYNGFLLKPNGFFDENPANDVPPSCRESGQARCKHRWSGKSSCTSDHR